MGRGITFDNKEIFEKLKCATCVLCSLFFYRNWNCFKKRLFEKDGEADVKNFYKKGDPSTATYHKE